VMPSVFPYFGLPEELPSSASDPRQVG